MEDRGYDGNDAEETTQPPLAAQEGFFTSWLLKKNETQTKAEEDDNDEEKESSSDKKKKKQSAISRFISKLLGEDRADEEKSSDTQVAKAETTEALPQRPMEADQEIAIAQEETVQENQIERTEERSTVESQQLTDDGELRIEHDEDDSPDQAIEGDNSSEPETVEQPRQEQSVPTNEYDIASHRAAEQLDNQQAETVQASPERQYGGESDWKLKREIRRLKRRVKQQEAATKRIKAQAKEAEDQLEAMHAQQRKFEASLVPKKKPETTTVIKVEKQPKQEAFKTPENTTLTKLEAKELKLPIEKVATQEEAKVAPKEVLKTVVEAVDNNVAIERQFERRHELKDQTAQANSSGATSVATILQGHSQTAVSPQPIAPPPMIPKQHTIPASSDRSQSPRLTYAQAVAGGFIASMIALIFITIMIVVL